MPSSPRRPLPPKVAGGGGVPGVLGSKGELALVVWFGREPAMMAGELESWRIDHLKYLCGPDPGL